MAILPATASEGESTCGIPMNPVPSRARLATERRLAAGSGRAGTTTQVPVSLPFVPNRWSWAKGVDELRRCRPSTTRYMRRCRPSTTRSLSNRCKQSRLFVDSNTPRDSKSLPCDGNSICNGTHERC